MTVEEHVISLEQVRKFKKIGKDYFLFDPSKIFDPMQVSPRISKFLNLNIPPEYNEFFLTEKNFPLFLINYQDHKGKKETVDFSNNIIKELILKLNFAKSDKEKDILTSNLYQIAKKKNNTFMEDFLLLAFLTSSSRLMTDELIHTKIERVANEEFEDKDPKLNYFKYLLLAITKIKLDEWESANYYLNEAKKLTSCNLNILFYELLFNLQFDQIDNAEEILDSITAIEMERIEHAMDRNSERQLDFFLGNPFLSNIFNYDQCALLLPKIQNMVNTAEFSIDSVNKILNELRLFEHKKWKDYKTDEIVHSYQFLDSVLKKYSKTKLFLFIKSINLLHKKMLNTIQTLNKNIIESYQKVIEEKLHIFDEKIDAINNHFNELEREKELYISRIDERMNSTISNYKERVSQTINYYDNMLDNLEKTTSSASVNTLKNSIAYNLVFALFVVLTGGFAELSNGRLSDIASLSSVIASIFFGGLKWGAISFMVGIVISIFVFFSSTMNRFNTKSSLIKRISNLNEEKEYGIESIREQYKVNKDEYVLNFETKKNAMIKQLDDLKEKREEERLKLVKSIEDEINEFTAPLKKALQSTL